MRRMLLWRLFVAFFVPQQRETNQRRARKRNHPNAEHRTKMVLQIKWFPPSIDYLASQALLVPAAKDKVPAATLPAGPRSSVDRAADRATERHFRLRGRRFAPPCRDWGAQVWQLVAGFGSQWAVTRRGGRDCHFGVALEDEGVVLFG